VTTVAAPPLRVVLAENSGFPAEGQRGTSGKARFARVRVCVGVGGGGGLAGGAAGTRVVTCVDWDVFHGWKEGDPDFAGVVTVQTGTAPRSAARTGRVPTDARRGPLPGRPGVDHRS